MTYCTDTRYDFTAYDHPPATRRAFPQNIIGGAGLACAVLACAWVLYSNLVATGDDAMSAVERNAPPVTAPAATVTAETAAATAQTVVAKTQTVVTKTRTVVATAPDQSIDPNDPYILAALFDSSYASGARPGTFAGSAPVESGFPSMASASSQVGIAATRAAVPPAARQLALSVPLPLPRPAELRSPPPASSRNPSLQAMAHRNKAPVASTATSDSPTILERLFGKPQPAGTTLAYASPDGGIFDDGQSLPSGRSLPTDKRTAIYDISAHTVYMPDGSKLEAHSGLGSRLDDPRHVAERMRGPTPPHVYDLTMREAPFHGVQALRLNPVGGEGNVFGRTGLLAHTYMLGPNGDSNGCVSFRNYNAFLRAYMNHEVERLVVVARLH